MSDTSVTTCYRHPQRETYVRCTRCDRYICADCMREAAVGHQCVECVREGNRTVRQARTVFGASVSQPPVLTFVLIGVNLLAYLAEIAMPSALDRFDMIGLTLIGPDGAQYVYEGFEGDGYRLAGVAAGEWYRLFTGAFLHLPPSTGFGLLHIGFNMMWLWTLGRQVEQQLGWARYLALYLLSALGASVLVLLLDPLSSVVGASGAVFGLAVAAYVIGRRVGHGAVDNRLMIFFLVWLVATAGFASWQGHLGGLLAGGALALAYAYTPAERRLVLHAAAVAGLALVLTGLVVAKSVELRDPAAAVERVVGHGFDD
ncbi:rhomboid family intramembrane serine protease [Nonomuraea sp. NPDC050556]|uniref:rhomboid family intramembrane serine protease n=1 Tax=Nonomuraea sp. NPDC050556 TaxID=3364369 RepID=UPI0037A69C20